MICMTRPFKLGLFCIPLFSIFVLILPVPIVPTMTHSLRAESFKDSVLKRSMVLVNIVSVYYDPLRPWIRKTKPVTTSLGLVLEGNQILVTSDDVNHAALIEVAHYSSYQKSFASVVYTDQDANLAILSVKNQDFFQHLRPLKIGKDPKPGTRVTGLRIDGVFNVYRDRFRIREISLVSRRGFTDIPMSEFYSKDSFRYGGVLVHGNSVCGFISFFGSQNKGQAVLPSIIQSFLRGAKRQKNNPAPKSLFVSQGFYLSGMADPIRREYYGLPPNLQGALITKTLPGTSSWKVLKKGDILLSVDGVELDDIGLFSHPSWGRQPAQLLLAMKGKSVREEGEVVPLSVFRRRKVISVQILLQPFKLVGERILSKVKGQPPYLVENGIVFLELSVPLLKTIYGANWREKTILPSYLFSNFRHYDKSSSDRFLFIASVFPDPATRKLARLRYSLLKKVGRKKVSNLQELRQKILDAAKSGRKTLRLSMYGGIPLYLDLVKRDEINSRILKKYKIPSTSPF